MKRAKNILLRSILGFALLWGIPVSGSPADLSENPDGDGLVNLHEYWAGCDPWTVDGTNTLLSVIATSIDSRIAGKNPAIAKLMYNNYTNNAAIGVFERNTNCWAYGIDLSASAVWRKNGSPHYHHLATLISPRHALGANHASVGVGDFLVFQSMDGMVVTNRVSAKAPLVGGDISIYLMENEMPTNFLRPNSSLQIMTTTLEQGSFCPCL